ncbi:hypothetical protein V498_05038 [Pseudogymnoascus sp. VKM F-4517 (FW-2822)]|nr:hypothetical protein V498_05038 [Pseudogymnoascus sp. VKM F-4517 (FW-2822)]
MAKGSSAYNASKATHRFDINGLYILLSKQEIPDTWHWGLYLHGGPNGWVFHITRIADMWIFDKHLSPNIIHSMSMEAALKIAVLDDPRMRQALNDRISTVPLEDTARFGRLTCRTWVLRAIYELDTEGYISLKPGATVEELEAEAKGKALRHLVQAAVEHIRVTTVLVGIVVLPDGLERPTRRHGAGRGAIPSQHKRAGAAERRAVPRALGPPISGGVDHWVNASLGVVGVDKVLDPGHHRRRGEAEAGCAGGVVLDVEHAGEGDAVLGPAAAVGDEVGCLRGAGGGAGVGKVVATADEASLGGASVLGGESGGNVTSTCEVDSGLVAGDVEPLDGGTLLDLGWSRCGKAEDGDDGEGRELHVGDLNRIVDTTEKDWRTIIGGTTSLYIR